MRIRKRKHVQQVRRALRQAAQSGKQVLLALSRNGAVHKTVATALESRSQSALRYSDRSKISFDLAGFLVYKPSTFSTDAWVSG